MRIVLAGGSGFLGTALHRSLADDGHVVVRLVRREPAGPDEVRWQPERGRLEPRSLAGADAVINLAGVGVADKRWNEPYKALIRSSRVDPTATIAAALASLSDPQRPSVLLNSSAVGYYGDTGDQPVDETSASGEGFFPQVCQTWEQATAPAAEAGVRVVLMRTGLPLDSRGGLLKPLVLPFRLGLGGPIGNGRQWMPWISLPDWLAATQFLIASSEIAGPVNLVGPQPVRNVDFARALGAVLHRPAVLTLPGFAVTTLIGQFGREALSSQRVLPGVLGAAGFSFSQPDIAAGLRAAFARNPR